MPKVQSKRTSKTSSGNGMKHRRTTLTGVQKINMGKGLMINVANRYREKSK